MDANAIQTLAGLGIMGIGAYEWAWCNNRKAAIAVFVGGLVGWVAISLALGLPLF